MNNKIFLQSPKPQNSFILSNSSVCACMSVFMSRHRCLVLGRRFAIDDAANYMAVILKFCSPTYDIHMRLYLLHVTRELGHIHSKIHVQAYDTLSHRSNTNKKPIKICKNVWKYILNKYNLLLRSRATLLRLFQSNCAAGESSYAIGQVERQLSVWLNRCYGKKAGYRRAHSIHTKRNATGIVIPTYTCIYHEYNHEDRTHTPNNVALSI